MKKIVTISLLAVTVLAAILIFYLFEQESVDTGKYTVVYYKNRCDLNPRSLPADLESLKRVPCLIRITWQEKVAAGMYQEYCYLPGKEVEKTRSIHKKD
jgi:hypothetical protein